MKEYPLHWPEGHQRTVNRVSSQFRSSLSAALKNVATSLDMFGKDSGSRVSSIILSSNVGGLSLSAPSDPGVAAWFTWDGEQRCIAVDRYTKPECNLQAIHHILEARRTELRHGGILIVRQTFKGFTALPAPERWQDVLGFAPGSIVTRDDVTRQYRIAAAVAHPDKPGGSQEKMARLNAARDAALREIPA